MGEAKVRPEALEAIFKSAWSKPGMAIKSDALDLSAELLLLFAKEAVARAKAKHAESGRAEDMIDESDLEKILAQLLLDF